MMHSRTVEDIFANLQYADQRNVLCMAHGKPQPEAENHVTAEGLASGAPWLWYVDDDMQLPPEVLAEMLYASCKSPVVVAHYPCTKQGNDAVHIRDGKFESAGMGCVLVKREVFDQLKQPYFRTDTQYVWDTDHLQPYPARTDQGRHGGHDVDFFQRLLKLGIEPAIIETRCGQYNLLDTSIKKYGNMTQQTVETWRL